MGTITIYVIVDQDKELINQLCRIAFKNHWEIDDWSRPNNLSKFTNAELEKLIEEYGTYKARVLAFKVRPKSGALEINFLRLPKRNHSPSERIDNGHDKTELKSAISWIQDQKYSVGLCKRKK
jgi:hypothetical protein